MDANMRAHYESLRTSSKDQQVNFEVLYKEIFNITVMPLKPHVEGEGGAPVYVSRKHQKDWMFFKYMTSQNFTQKDGVNVKWVNLSLMDWIYSGFKFSKTPKHTLTQNPNLSWNIIFTRKEADVPVTTSPL